MNIEHEGESHDEECRKYTLCLQCGHCEYSVGPVAETCRCKECSCYEINFGGDPK